MNYVRMLDYLLPEPIDLEDARLPCTMKLVAAAKRTKKTIVSDRFGAFFDRLCVIFDSFGAVSDRFDGDYG